MSIKNFYLLFLLLGICVNVSSAKFNYPFVKRNKSNFVVYNGIKFPQPYAWMRDIKMSSRQEMLELVDYQLQNVTKPFMDSCNKRPFYKSIMDKAMNRTIYSWAGKRGTKLFYLALNGLEMERIKNGPAPLLYFLEQGNSSSFEITQWSKINEYKSLEISPNGSFIAGLLQQNIDIYDFNGKDLQNDCFQPIFFKWTGNDSYICYNKENELVQYTIGSAEVQIFSRSNDTHISQPPFEIANGKIYILLNDQIMERNLSDFSDWKTVFQSPENKTISKAWGADSNKMLLAVKSKIDNDTKPEYELRYLSNGSLIRTFELEKVSSVKIDCSIYSTEAIVTVSIFELYSKIYSWNLITGEVKTLLGSNVTLEIETIKYPSSAGFMLNSTLVKKIGNINHDKRMAIVNIGSEDSFTPKYIALAENFEDIVVIQYEGFNFEERNFHPERLPQQSATKQQLFKPELYQFLVELEILDTFTKILVKNDIVKKGKIILVGGEAGALGAITIVNRNPELFAAVYVTRSYKPDLTHLYDQLLCPDNHEDKVCVKISQANFPLFKGMDILGAVEMIRKRNQTYPCFIANEERGWDFDIENDGKGHYYAPNEKIEFHVQLQHLFGNWTDAPFLLLDSDAETNSKSRSNLMWDRVSSSIIHWADLLCVIEQLMPN